MSDDLRPIDYAGFVPSEPVADEKQDDTRSADYERGYQDGFETGLLKYAITLLERASIDATGLREQLEQLERRTA